MAIRLGPVSAARSRPFPANGAGRAADQGLPRGEPGIGREVAVTLNVTVIVIRARDSNPHGPRPAAQQRGSGPRPVIVTISVSACRGLWPGRGHLRPRGARNIIWGPQWSDWQRRVSELRSHVVVELRRKRKSPIDSGDWTADPPLLAICLGRQRKGTGGNRAKHAIRRRASTARRRGAREACAPTMGSARAVALK